MRPRGSRALALGLGLRLRVAGASGLLRDLLILRRRFRRQLRRRFRRTRTPVKKRERVGFGNSKLFVVP